MLINELKSDLQNLIGRNLSQTELGIAMGNLKRQTINTRIKNNSEVTVTELLNAQKYFKKPLYVRTDEKNYKFIKNSLERRNNIEISEQINYISIRLNEIQEKHEYLDKDMAKLLKISEDEYIDLKSCKKELDIKTLNRLKQLFEISIDWLLYGE